MATQPVQLETAFAPPIIKAGPVITVNALEIEERPSTVVLYDLGQDHIVQEIASALGQPWATPQSESEAVLLDREVVAGVTHTSLLAASLDRWKATRTVLSTHCLDDSNAHVGSQTSSCDYEYLYTTRPFPRRDLARFLALILGQSNPHKALKSKKKTTLISTTFPDVHAALPNLDILSVGADAVEASRRPS